MALITDGAGMNGGIARYNQDLLSALALTPAVGGLEVLPRFARSDASAQHRVVHYPPSPSRAAWAARAVALAARGSFDVIFCGHLNAAPLAASLARLTSKRLWLQVHGIEAWAARGSAIERALERAALVTAVSRFTRERLLSWSGVDPERVRVLPNTVSEIPGRRPRPERLVTRHRLENKRVLLTVGRLSAGERYKGHDRLIEALPAILSRQPDAAYVIVGQGDDAARLSSLAASVGVRDQVIFAGQMAANELPSYFQLADVFAMPSTGEGFGVVFLEAAACGIPVIAGNRDGSVDALGEGALGTLVDPGNRAELVEAVLAAFKPQHPTGVEAVRRFEFPNFARHVDGLVRHYF